MEHNFDENDSGGAYLLYELERRAYPLGAETFIIGRDATSDIVIRESAVSRTHAEVTEAGGEYVLKSSGATGTRVNGEPVSAPRPLREGDRIEIGTAEITFRRSRLPLGVSIVDRAAEVPPQPDATTRRQTITNPILSPVAAASTRKKRSVTVTVLLALVALAAVAFYLLSR